MRARHFGTSFLLAAGLLLSTSKAHADGPFEGDWRQGATRIEVQVQTWGPDCGPRPQSSTVPARGTVHVTQDGDHLAFGARRSTRGCWSDNRAVRLVSSRVGSGSWTILCRTPADDPRRETGNYTLRSTGQDRIELRDETDYDWTLNESHCTATVVSTQTFERIPSGATPTPVEPVTPVTPEPVEPACTAGPAARIAMRPSSGEIEPGERLCFQPRVVDAAGCAVRGVRVDLTASQGTISGNCFEAAGAGTVTIIARANDLEARATVQVRQSDLSGLIARRVESGDLATDPASAPGRDAGVAVHTNASSVPSLWLLAVAGISVLLAILSALALASRSRKRAAELRARAEREEAHARAVEAARQVVPEVVVAAAPAPPAETGNAMICPVCRRGYAAGVVVCPRDKEKLVPYAEFVTRRAQSAPERVCSKCGERYASTVTFCGKDGTPLA